MSISLPSRTLRSSPAATTSSPVSARCCRADALITTEAERRTFETDALTAYRGMPLAVVLPGTTEEVAAVLRFCHDNSSRSCRAAPAPRSPAARCRRRTRSSLGIARMNRVLDIDYDNRTARVRPASPISPSPTPPARDGFFYAPDPSSQLACTHRRQHRHEFRRRPLPEIRRHHQQPARRHAWC